MKRAMRMWLTTAAGVALVISPVFHASVVAKEKVTIAFIGPLTGSTSHIGLGGRNSADLAVRLRNKNPAAKYEYELVSLDDECKPNIGVQVVTKAGSDQKISAAVAHYCSAVGMATVGVFHKFGLPMTTFTAIAPEITDGQKYAEIHRIIDSAVEQNRIGPKFMRELGYQTWVVIHDTTAFGTENDKYFVQYLDKVGGKILANFGSSPDQQDFSAELTRIRELNPQVVYLESLAPLGTRVRLQMEKSNVNAQFDSVSGVFSDDFIKTLGPVAEGALSRRIGTPIEELSGGQEFLTKYAEQKYEQPADVWGHYAYAEANLLMDVIEQVGTDRTKIAQALSAVKDHPTIAGLVTFNDHGQNIYSNSSVVVVQDGKWVSWDKSEYASGKRKLKRLPN